MIPHQKLPNSQQNPDNLSHQRLSNSSQAQQSSESDTQPHPQLLQKTLKTLRKLKKIAKEKKLTELKIKNKAVNSIFKSMSQLFFVRSKAVMQKKQKQKQLRQIRRKALKNVGIRNKQNLLKNMQNPENNQNQPQEQDLRLGFSQSLINSTVQINQLKCYICKSRFTRIHQFYDCLCPQCGDFNYSKRTQSANLEGLVALVTGGRIKIGFETALKLLRDGATVIATSRFLNDTLLRYQEQHDYNSWSCRLYIIQCDFTSSYQVQEMISKIKERFNRMDILINNAAQTIVRPKEFYLQELVNSRKMIDNVPEQMRDFYVSAQLQHMPLNSRYPSLYLPDKQPAELQLQMVQSSPSTQIQVLRESNLVDHSIRDQFDQPLDKRSTNSWVQQLQDVSLVDCYTTQLVNSIVPFHLISQLKPLMKKTTSHTDNPSFIINVSSMEGVFSRINKQSTHPHTNMAKAALNMITRTCSQQFVKDGIYMSSVDTGWVTEQNPTTFKLQRAIPLDCVDGAMRVLDPIYVWKLTGYRYYGKFLKDYKQSKW